MNRPTPLRARERTQGQRIRRGERKHLKRQFFIAYAQSPCVSSACRQVGISRSGFYQWLELDAKFKEKYQAISAVYFDIWLWSSPDDWKAHLKRRKQGHRLIRYYLGRDIPVASFETMRDVRREQSKHGWLVS